MNVMITEREKKRCSSLILLFLLTVPLLFSKEFTPEVVVNRIMLNRSVFYSDAGLGTISTIQAYRLNKTLDTLAFVGTKGAVFLGDDNTVRLSVRYESDTYSNADLIDLENDGVPEFLGRGSWYKPAVVFDSKGNKVLSFPGNIGMDDAEAGDLDNDGMTEIVAGYNGWGGLVLFDNKGVKKWKQKAGNCWKVAIADFDRDGLMDVISLEGSGQFKVRDNNGKIKIHEKIRMNCCSFTMTNWHDDYSRTKVLYIRDIKFAAIRDVTLKDLALFEIEGFSDATSYSGEAFEAYGKKYYAAVFSDHDNWTVFCIYDSLNAKVYEERFAKNGKGLYVSGGEIYVGLDGEVIKYGIWK